MTNKIVTLVATLIVMRLFVSGSIEDTSVGDNIMNRVFDFEVVFLKNFWSFIYLLVVLLDMKFNFIGPKLDKYTGVVATIVIGYGIPGLIESNTTPTFQILFNLTAYFSMIFSLILKFSSTRKRLSNVAAAATCTCSTLGILSTIIGNLPHEYALACIGIVVTLLAINWVVYTAF